MRALVIILLFGTGCVSKPDRPAVDPDASPGDAEISADAIADAEVDAVELVDLCAPDACGAAGGTCTEGVCVIVATNDTFTQCPAGMPCRVDCLGKDACKPGVSCGDATTCEVRCEGESACRDRGGDCGNATACDVRCIGTNACEHHTADTSYSVDCGASACTVTCSSSGACHDGIGSTASGMCTGHCCLDACGSNTATCAIDDVCQ
jgi:hypothetical protein